MSIEMARRALLLPGFGYRAEDCEPLMNELTTGRNKITNDVDVLVLGDAFRDPRLLEVMAIGATVLAQSGGIVALVEAGAKPESLITINGPEPSKLLKDTGWGALRIAFDKHPDPEPGIEMPNMFAPIREILRRPQQLKLPFMIRDFSTSQAIIDMVETNFMASKQIAVFQSDKDWFGFTRTDDRLLKVFDAGVHVDILNGKHNDLFHRPRHVMDQVVRSLVRGRE